MNLKKILFICLILMILSITAVSAADSDNINATDSIEPTQTVEHDTNLQPISEKKTVALSNLKATSNSPGTFDDLQLEINNVEEGSVLVLTRDYNGNYGSRIHLDKDITIDGQGHTLDCLGEGGCSAFYSTTGTIVLKNIRIINGHNDYNDQGGALHIEGSAKYTLENCIFENNWADDYGGAIYNDGGVLTIKNCIFNGNTADDKSGGAIYSTKDVIIEGSTFTNNQAKSMGGAINCAGTVSINVNQTTGPYSSFFYNNKVIENYGGAINTKVINMKNAEFKENYEPGEGAVYIFDGGSNITHCLFESNMAEKENGGAIFFWEGGYINGCIFKSNTAHYAGGAIFSFKNIYVNNCTFEKNWAGITGGAIYSNYTYINTDQSEKEPFNTFFIENSVSDSGINSNRGGAIYTYNGGRIVNAYFKNNNAKVDGGAIYSNKYGTIGIDHCLFEDNSATGSTYQCYGGAIRSDSDVYIHNSTFKNNYADDYSGAIYAKNVRINHDREYETADTFFIDNKAKDDDGGAIYAEDDVFARNVAFINNVAYVDGGAIYAGKNVEVIHSIFESNHATGAPSSRCYGGAIRAKENAKINNCTFKNNHADNRGGAIHASTVTTEGGPSRFEGNSAKDYGGAIYTETFTDPVSHVSFINNIANAGDGGAIYINKENSITFTDCTFIDNKAISKGGAIYMDSKYSHINIVNSVFINNGAGEGQSVYTRGYYDPVSTNYWSTIPNENNDQLVEWKALSSNIHHTDSNPATFTLAVRGILGVNLSSTAIISFVRQDRTSVALPMIAEYFSISGPEEIKIGDKKITAEGVSIPLTPTKVGTYELTFNIYGITTTITLNVKDGVVLI